MSKNIGSIRIITKKYVKDIEKYGHKVPTRYRTVKNIYGVLPFEKLPEEYKTGSFVYFDSEIGAVMYQDKDRKEVPKTVLCLGEEISDADYKVQTNIIRDCGNRLFALMKHKRELKKLEEWTGKDVTRI